HRAPGDLRDDLLLFDAGSAWLMWHVPASQDYAPQPLLPDVIVGAAHPIDGRLADVDGDGWLDVVLACRVDDVVVRGAVVYFRNRQEGTLAARVVGALPVAPTAMAVADIALDYDAILGVARHDDVAVALESRPIDPLASALATVVRLAE